MADRGRSRSASNGMDGKIPSLNLISRVKPETPARQPGVYKPIIFDVLSVIAAYGVGWAYAQYLTAKMPITNLSAVLVAFAALSTLQVFFTKGLDRRLLILILETIAMLFLFYKYDLRILSAAAAVLLVFRLWGEKIGRTELENGLEVRFFKAALPALQKLTTALIVAFVILYFPQWSQKNAFVSKDAFQTFFEWTAGTVKNFYPTINLSSSFGNLTQDLARFGLLNNPDFRNLPAQNQELMVKQAAVQVADSLRKNIGGEILNNEPVSGVVYRLILETLTRWKDQFQNWFLVGWAIAVFFVIRGFGFIFYGLAGLIAFIIYQILLSFGFIHIFGESRTHETIEF